MVECISAEDTKVGQKSAYLGEISTFLTKISCTSVTFVNTVNNTLKVCKFLQNDVFSKNNVKQHLLCSGVH